MLKDQNIICFGSARWEYPGLQQTVMRLFSRKNRILFFNAIGTRKISLDYGLWLAVRRRLKNRTTNVTGPPGIHVYSLKTIPFYYNSIASRVNEALISRQCRKTIDSLAFSPCILWIGTPMAAALMEHIQPQLLVYNPVDRYHAFSFVNPEKMMRLEHQIAKRADLVICTSDAIRKDLQPYNDAVYNVSHGVDFGHFSSAFSREEVPEDIRDIISQPVIGYFGGLSERVNLRIIATVAEAHKEATLLLIGPKLADLNGIEKYPNVRILAHKPFAALPQYLKAFDVCLIPYHVNTLMEGVDPIKLKEYFCLGKPVVSTAIPEVVKYGNLVYIGKDEQDFSLKVGQALDEKGQSIRSERILTAKKSDWSVKIEEISELVENALYRKTASRRTSHTAGIAFAEAAKA